MIMRILTASVATFIISSTAMAGPIAVDIIGDRQESLRDHAIEYASHDVAQEGAASDDAEVAEQPTPSAGPGPAITGWIEQIDDTKDWTAGFSDLTYDPATDTAHISGLTIENTAIQLTIAFEPISFAGYAEHDDSKFQVESIATAGATLTAPGLNGAIVDIRLDGLGNIASELSSDIAWDPLRPFTSLMRTYTDSLDFRLSHGGIGSASLVVDDAGDDISLTFEEFSIDGWADGKFSSATTGPIKFAAPNSHDPVVMTIAGSALKDVDYAAMLRLYDPDQYVDGVGDGIWRTVMGLIEYKDIVIDTPDARVGFGAVSAENFRARQPERSIAEFLDEAMLNPLADEEPTQEEIRTVLGFVSAFQLGALKVSDVNVEGEDGTEGHIGGMSIIDVSVGGLSEFSIDNLVVRNAREGSVILRRFAFGDVVLPALELLIEAAEAEEAGRDFDYSQLGVELAFIELLGVDVDVPDSPRFQLDKMRLDLGNYVGPLPTSLALDISGIDLPASAIDDSTLRGMWQMLGYDRIRGEFSAKLAWNESEETVGIDDFRFSIGDVGAFSMSAEAGGLSRQELGDLEDLPDALAEMDFIRGALNLENYAVLDRWVERQSVLTASKPDDIRQQVAILLTEMASGFGDASFQDRLRQVLENSIKVPGSVTATIMPAQPVPFSILLALAEIAPATLPNLLSVAIEHAP